jgi:hypothetical protein
VQESAVEIGVIFFELLETEVVVTEGLLIEFTKVSLGCAAASSISNSEILNAHPVQTVQVQAE